MMAKIIPQSVKTTLWSYNTEKIDLKEHKRAIIGQVLNYGDKQATDWLFNTYSKKVLKEEAGQIPLGQWDKKSLALWKLILDIDPRPKSERVLNDK